LQKVFVSMNVEGQLVITPAGEHRRDEATGESADLTSILQNGDGPQSLDSRGRLKLPADILQFLLGNQSE
jgi:hypothetical protein